MGCATHTFVGNATERTVGLGTLRERSYPLAGNIKQVDVVIQGAPGHTY